MDKAEKIDIIKAAIERREAAKREKALQEWMAMKRKRLNEAQKPVKKYPQQPRITVTINNATMEESQKIDAMKSHAVKVASEELSKVKESLDMAEARYNEVMHDKLMDAGARKNVRLNVEYLRRKVRTHEKMVKAAMNKVYQLPKKYIPKYGACPKETFIEAQERQNAIGYYSIEQMCVKHSLSRQAVSHRISLGLVTPHLEGVYKFISEAEMLAATEHIKTMRKEKGAALALSKKNIAV